MISIVAPAFNEEEVIEKFVHEVMAKAALPGKWELVVVNDGSTDSTAARLLAMKRKFPLLKVVSYGKNRGFGGALKAGIESARGSIIVTMDADLTHPPQLISGMVQKIDSGYAVCIASRYCRGGGMLNVPCWRIVISRLANFAFMFLFGSSAMDLSGGFKAYDAGKLKAVKITKTDFSVQMEIMARLLKEGCRVAEVPLVLDNRKLGRSKFNFFKSALPYIFTVMELFFVRWFHSKGPE